MPLPSGAALPVLGFGTWRLSGPAATSAVTRALEVGYRHVDTATIYDNEAEVGAGLRASGVPRDEVFVTTKLPPERAGRERETLEQSLAALGLDAVDLWLVHWPPAPEVGLDVWRAFLAARDEGLVRDVGVSNYSLAQLDEVVEATGVLPAVNQISWSVHRFDAALLEGHRERGVVVEGYSGLKRGTMDEPVVQQIAERLGRSPAQVLLRWQLDHDVVAIPKSSDPARLAANADLDDLVLSAEDRARLDSLTQR
jgi:2,5-diketo-D-gluconate reductase A